MSHILSKILSKAPSASRTLIKVPHFWTPSASNYYSIADHVHVFLPLSSPTIRTHHSNLGCTPYLVVFIQFSPTSSIFTLSLRLQNPSKHHLQVVARLKQGQFAALFIRLTSACPCVVIYDGIKEYVNIRNTCNTYYSMCLTILKAGKSLTNPESLSKRKQGRLRCQGV